MKVQKKELARSTGDWSLGAMPKHPAIPVARAGRVYTTREDDL